MNRKPKAFFLAALLLTGCAAAPAPTSQPASATQPASAEVKIQIDNFTFTPATVTVSPGTKVVWINHDDVPHTATSTTKVFASHALDTDEKFEFVFAKAGTFPYY